MENDYYGVGSASLSKRNLSDLEKRLLIGCEAALTAFYLRDHVETGLLIKYLKEIIAEAKQHAEG